MGFNFIFYISIISEYDSELQTCRCKRCDNIMFTQNSLAKRCPHTQSNISSSTHLYPWTTISSLYVTVLHKMQFKLSLVQIDPFFQWKRFPAFTTPSYCELPFLFYFFFFLFWFCHITNNIAISHFTLIIDSCKIKCTDKMAQNT